VSSYICEKCGSVENSATEGANYWMVFNVVLHGDKSPPYFPWVDEYANTHLLCSGCTPKERLDRGVVVIDYSCGKWHEIFEREHWSKFGSMEQILESHASSRGNFENAKDYFQKYGEHGHPLFKKYGYNNSLTTDEMIKIYIDKEEFACYNEITTKENE
jgi:hypothetical protein